MKVDPIIAVKDVETSSKWYQSVFGWKGMHGGNEFEVLVAKDDEIMLCLHKWGAHEHPSMTDPSISPGNGLILYFRIENMDEIRQNVDQAGFPVESEIQLSPNSRKREFSLRDPDGYYLTVSEFHQFKG